MKETFLYIISASLEPLGIGWYNYYREWSVKLHIYFNCRQNKYTKRKYFRSMLPIVSSPAGSSDFNRWIEYYGNIDDNISYERNKR